MQQSSLLLRIYVAIVGIALIFPLAIVVAVSFDPGSYIVQSRGVLSDPFRERLTRAGARIVSYIPNNAYLVRATQGAARNLSSSPLTQFVLPFEPYYKLDSRLLPLAVNGELLPHPLLNIVSFPRETARAW